MTNRMFSQLAALVLAIALLIASAVPALAGKDPSDCYKVRDRSTGLTTIVCPDGSWD
jgi:hypothetical protein